MCRAATLSGADCLIGQEVRQLQPFRVKSAGSNLPPPPREPSTAPARVAVAVAPNFILFYFFNISGCYAIHKKQRIVAYFLKVKKIMNHVLRSNQNSRSVAAREKRINDRDPNRLLDLRFYS